MIAILMYGCVGKEVLRLPAYVRSFFEQHPSGEYDEAAVANLFDYEELTVCQDYIKLGYPFFSSISKFGMVVSVCESGKVESVVELPRKIRRKFRKLLLPYDLYPAFWHFVIEVKE